MCCKYIFKSKFDHEKLYWKDFWVRKGYDQTDNASSYTKNIFYLVVTELYGFFLLSRVNENKKHKFIRFYKKMANGNRMNSVYQDRLPTNVKQQLQLQGFWLVKAAVWKASLKRLSECAAITIKILTTDKQKSSSSSKLVIILIFQCSGCYPTRAQSLFFIGFSKIILFISYIFKLLKNGYP